MEKGSKMTELNKQEAVAALATAVSEFNAALTKAMNIADEYGLSFNIHPCYGAGAYYEGIGDKEDIPDKWGDPQYGWRASSQSC